MHFITLTFRMLVNVHFQFKSITAKIFWKAIYTVTMRVWNPDRKLLQ